MRIALGVEYDGAGFCGWQSQSNLCGAQDVLELAIKKLALHDVRIHAAGRTDSGVHALMQVVHFDTPTDRPENAWVRGVNAHLPDALRVVWSKFVDDAFHARFSAIGRGYEYLLVNSAVAPAILINKAGWYHLPLDVAAMQEGIQFFVGEHDFSAFRASECQAKTAIRTIRDVSINEYNNKLIFKFEANAFLQHQVRNMIGALIYIGNGKYLPNHVQTLLKNKDRTLSPPTFSPNGLYLTRVEYEKKWLLPTCQRQLDVI
jgi:tRNA pseudouridine38-40 synthase